MSSFSSTSATPPQPARSGFISAAAAAALRGNSIGGATRRTTNRRKISKGKNKSDSGVTDGVLEERKAVEEVISSLRGLLNEIDQTAWIFNRDNYS